MGSVVDGRYESSAYHNQQTPTKSKEQRYKEKNSNFTYYQPYERANTLRTSTTKKKFDKLMQNYLSIFVKGSLYGF